MRGNVRLYTRAKAVVGFLLVPLTILTVFWLLSMLMWRLALVRIPKLEIFLSTVDPDLSLHLILFGFLVIPPTLGLSKLYSWLRHRCIEISSHSDGKPPILLLRSFSDLVLQKRPGTLGLIGLGAHLIGLPGLLTSSGGDDYAALKETGTVLSPFGRLVMLRSRRSRSTVDEWSEHLEVCVPDEKWEAAFRILAAGSRAIVLIPSTTPSAIQEVRLLREHPSLLARTLVVLPPTFKAAPLTLTNKYKPRERWNAIRMTWQEVGVSLVEYAPEGIAYVPTTDFSIPAKRFELRYVITNVARALEELVPLSPSDSRPLAELLNAVEELDHQDQG